MLKNTNFFSTLSESVETQINNEADRKKVQNKITKALSKLFNYCTSKVDSYSLYEKMFDILNAYDTNEFKKVKFEKSEFISVIEGKKQTKDASVKSILGFCGKDGDINDVSYKELIEEYKEYFNMSNYNMDTFHFTGRFEFNNQNTNDPERKKAIKIWNKKYKKLTEAGFCESNIIALLTNNSSIKKAIKYKDSGVQQDLIPYAIQNKCTIKDVLKLQKMKLSINDCCEILSKYSVDDAYALLKAGINKNEVYSALCKNFTQDKIEQYRNLGIPYELINDAARETHKYEISRTIQRYDYDTINELYHGERIDKSLEDWTITVGDKKVQIKTDNNMYTMDYALKYGVPKNGTCLFDREIEAIKDSLKQMTKLGQDIPETIYLTDILPCDCAGCYNRANKNSIFINNNSCRNIDYLKEVIYHESAHMKDFKTGENKNYKSAQKNIEINSSMDEINFSIEDKKYNIQTSDIEKLISKYSLTTTQEFVAEVTAMITSGKIRQKPDGSYKIKTKSNGTYKNAKGHIVEYGTKDAQALNNIMALYNYLTEGKIVTPMKTK